MKRAIVLFVLFCAVPAAAGCVDSMDIAGPALGGMSESSSMLALQVVPDRPAGGTLQGSPVPGPMEARSAGPSADVALVRVVSGPAAFVAQIFIANVILQNSQLKAYRVKSTRDQPSTGEEGLSQEHST
jgi:hypothetical protein